MGRGGREIGEDSVSSSSVKKLSCGKGMQFNWGGLSGGGL